MTEDTLDYLDFLKEEVILHWGNVAGLLYSDLKASELVEVDWRMGYDTVTGRPQALATVRFIDLRDDRPIAGWFTMLNGAVKRMGQVDREFQAVPGSNYMLYLTAGD